MKVLSRDNYTCRICRGKKKDVNLETHHIVCKENDGSDDEDNLITLCHTCHKRLHDGKIKFKPTDIKEKEKEKSRSDVLREQLFNRYPDAVKTYGCITSANRKFLSLDKSYWMDASLIATGGDKPVIKTDLYIKKAVSEGDFQKTKGSHGERMIPDRLEGIRRLDKVSYLGKEYFVKNLDVAGYASLSDIYGKKADFSYMPRGLKTPKLKNIKRVSARSSQLTERVPLEQSVTEKKKYFAPVHVKEEKEPVAVQVQEAPSCSEEKKKPGLFRRAFCFLKRHIYAVIMITLILTLIGLLSAVIPVTLLLSASVTGLIDDFFHVG